MLRTRQTVSAVVLAGLVSLCLAQLVVNRRDLDPRRTAPEGSEQSYGEEAERWQRLILQDEHGAIPTDGYLRVLAHREQLGRRTQRMAAAGVTPTSWTWLGPSNYAGRARTIAIHPVRTNQLLVGSASGGVWKSTDDGATWRPTSDFLKAMGITNLAIDQTNPEHVCAGTGEVLAGAGVFCSTDFGETWQQVLGTEAMGNVYRVRFAPDGSLYAAAVLGISRISAAGSIVRLFDMRTQDLEIDPSNPQRLLASSLPRTGCE